MLLVGANGSGKSSLLRLLTGADEELLGGHVEGRRNPHGPHAERVGYLPQDPIDALLAFDPETEFRLRLQAAGWASAEAAAEATRRLSSLGLAAKGAIPVHRLSGGERKRLALRAAQAHDPGVLLLDEPLNHLDDEWRHVLLDEIVEAAASKLVIVASHEVDVWLPWATRVALLRQGALAWEGAATRFSEARATFGELPSRLADPYYPQPRFLPGATLAAHRLAATRGRPLFRDLDLTLPNGVHALVGPNGGGKTTLLRMLGGLEKPEAGRVTLDGEDVRTLTPRTRAQRIAIHLEDPARLFFHARVEEEISFQPGNADTPALEQEARVRRAADRFRLTELLDRNPHALSGGEQERTALACVEAAEPRLILLDEPTHGLDATGWADLVAFLERFRTRACVVVATHEPELARIADSVHRLEDGRFVCVRRGSASPLVEVTRRTPS